MTTGFVPSMPGAATKPSRVRQWVAVHGAAGNLPFLDALGLSGLQIAAAEGMYLTLADGRRIMDCGSGAGVYGIGHNHPRLAACRRRLLESTPLAGHGAFLSPYLAALQHNLAMVLPDRLTRILPCTSGADAVEGALKTAEEFHGGARDTFFCLSEAFHGKTYGALSVSPAEAERHPFRRLPECVALPAGDAAAARAAFAAHGRRAAALIVEAVQGARLRILAPDYLRLLRTLCTEYGVLLIADEILTGFGRTGALFAVSAAEITPDLMCFGKVLGGGAVPFAAYALTDAVFAATWGKRDRAGVPLSTFSGMAEPCVCANETLQIICEEGLVQNAQTQGAYLLAELHKLAARYPQRVREVRGCGLLLALDIHAAGGAPAEAMCRLAGLSAAEAVAGCLFAELLHQQGILAYLGYQRRDMLVLMPPLIINRTECERITNALDQVLRVPLPLLVARLVRTAVTN